MPGAGKTQGYPLLLRWDIQAPGGTAHPMGQPPAVWGLPWVMVTLSGPFSGACGSCKNQHIEFVSYKSLERLEMLGKCSKAPLGRSCGVLSALRP